MRQFSVTLFAIVKFQIQHPGSNIDTIFLQIWTKAIQNQDSVKMIWKLT